ncbi:hypothetical protein Tcan_00734, partial [Toxocara canis]
MRLCVVTISVTVLQHRSDHMIVPSNVFIAFQDRVESVNTINFSCENKNFVKRLNTKNALTAAIVLNNSPCSFVYALTYLHQTTFFLLPELLHRTFVLLFISFTPQLVKCHRFQFYNKVFLFTLSYGSKT